MGLPRLFLLVLLTLGGATGAGAQEAVPCGACAVVVMEADQALELPPALNELEVVVRQRSGDEPGVRAAVREIRARGGNPGVLVDGLPDPEAVRQSLAGSTTVLIRLEARLEDLVAPVFDLKVRLTRLRAVLPDRVQIGLWARPDVLDALLARDLAVYLDFVAGESPPSLPLPWWRAAGPLTAVRTAARDAQGRLGRSLWLAPRAPDLFARVLTDLAAAAAFFPRGLIPETELRVVCGADGVSVWVDPATLDRVVWVPPCDPGALRFPAGAAPTGQVRLSTGDLLARIPRSSPERFAQAVEVRAARTPTVQEIVARHQAAAARQAASVRTRISSGTLTLAFEAPGFAVPLTVASDVVIYSDRSRTDIEQRSLEVNGLAFAGRAAPRLPLVEPERVAALPLAIELTDAYAYELLGTETVDGVLCYVVRFEPVATRATLFRGRAWIAGDTFALVRTTATQVNLRGPIVSSEQLDEFARVEPGVWLLRESRINQVYEGAAHRTPIERVLTVHQHEINPADFVARRADAYASDRLMLRDTPGGYRYLRREPAAGGQVAGEERPTVIVEHGSEPVRTIVLGVMVDPNITRPLPFAGLSYVDFDLFGTGTQFNGFFGGTFGQLAFSVPALGRSRWQLAGRAFAVGSPFNDRAFDDGVERYDRNILQRPASAAVWALRPVTPHVSLRAGYYLDYVHYAAADTTRADFAVPSPQVVHALRVAVEGQRRGWNASLWWSPARRQGWRPWGLPEEATYRTGHRDFQRYGATLAKSAVLSSRLVMRGEAAWMGGRDLDRFSRYAFGAFDNRLTGYPGALIRYDRGAALRTAVAWAAAPRLRLDAFADSAFVHDPGFGPGLERFTGIGMGVEVPAPFGTLVAAEWGYGFQGIRAGGGRGTHVFKVTGYRVF